MPDFKYGDGLAIKPASERTPGEPIVLWHNDAAHAAGCIDMLGADFLRANPESSDEVPGLVDAVVVIDLRDQWHRERL
jgi:hypothetical protein